MICPPKSGLVVSAVRMPKAAIMATRPCFNSDSLIFLSSTSVFPLEMPNGSKNPMGARDPTMSSADIFRDEERTAGLKLAVNAEAAAREHNTTIN